MKTDLCLPPVQPNPIARYFLPWSAYFFILGLKKDEMSWIISLVSSSFDKYSIKGISNPVSSLNSSYKMGSVILLHQK